jgi:dTMP kinase
MERIRHTYHSEFEQNPYPGLFVVIEGLDGSGNSTQTERVYNHFRNMGIISEKVYRMKEPTPGPIGSVINSALSRGLKVDVRTMQLGFTADRSDDLSNPRGIDTYLRAGEFVLGDRYLFSTLAYGHASGLDMDWLIAVQSKFYLPDLTIFLDVPVEVCMGRLIRNRKGLDFFETTLQLEWAKEGYELAMQKFPGAIQRIDAEVPKEEVTREILSLIERHPKFMALEVS